MVHRGELLGVVDFVWPAYATVAEFDGRLKYAGSDSERDDRLWREKQREDRIREAGYEVVRLTWEQVTSAPREVAQRVRAAFARALARGSGSAAGRYGA